MKLIIGLGNPGEQYTNTRHNVGFMFIDFYANKNSCDKYKVKFDGLLTDFIYKNEKILLFKPLKFMNLSGIPISEIVNFYNIDLKDIIVIYDDMDLEFAHLRLREKGNPGSHNGMKNIVLNLHSNEFKRIRVGIGRPQFASFVDYVLSSFSKSELETLNNKFLDVAKACDLFIDNKFLIAMNQFNTGKEKWIK